MISKKNLNRLTFAHVKMNSIRNKFGMPASQVKDNADVIMISKTKLDDTFVVNQFFLTVLANPSALIP